MSDARITRLVDKLEKAKVHAQNIRKHGEKMTGRVVHTTLTVAGGAAVGALRGVAGKPSDGYKVYLPGTKVQADLVLGVALAGAGIAGLAGKHSDYAASVGNGMLAVLASEATLDAIKSSAHR